MVAASDSGSEKGRRASISSDDTSGDGGKGGKKGGSEEAEEEDYEGDEYDEYDEEEEEEEEEEGEYSDEDEEIAETESSEVDSENTDDTVSDVTNETEASDGFEMPEFERQTAQVIPEAPWAGFVAPCMQLLMSCLLPILLVVLSIYTIFKCTKAILQCILDLWTVIKRLIWFAIRLAFSPFYILYKILPEYIQAMIKDAYEENIGRKLRVVFNFKKRIEDAILDIPNVLMACALAGMETCITPMREHSGSVFWRFIGRHVDAWILKPLYDSHINRQTRKRKKNLDEARLRDPEEKARLKKLAPKKARAKAIAMRQKAKRLRLRRKQQQMEITLHIPMDKGKDEEEHAMQKVQLEDKTAAQSFSRTMIVERRYAVAVGFIWFMIGGVILVLTVDGSKGERCEICEEHTELAMKICRHGVGRDCAFHLHQNEVLMSIGVQAVGVLLLVYALFIYKPRQKSIQAVQEEKEKKQHDEEAQLGEMRKQEELELIVVRMIVEDMQKRRTPGRVLKQIAMKTPCASVQSTLSSFMNKPLGALFRWERRRRLAKRSIMLQDALLFMAGGWLRRVVKFLFNRDLSKSGKSGIGTNIFRAFTSFGTGEATTVRYAIFLFCQRSRCGKALQRLWKYFLGTKLGKRLVAFVESSPLAQRILNLLKELCTKVIGSPTAKTEARSILGSGSRSATSGGIITMEDTLKKFGLHMEEDKKEDKKKEHHAMDFLHHADAGLKETQLEAGTDEVNEGVLEEEPELIPSEDEEDPEEEEDEGIVSGGEGGSEEESDFDEDAEEEEEEEEEELISSM